MNHLYLLRSAYLLIILAILSNAFAADETYADPVCSNYEFFIEATPRASSKADHIAKNIYDILKKDKNGPVSYSINYIFNDQTINGYRAEVKRYNLSSNSSRCVSPSKIDVSLLASSIRRIERKKGSREGVHTYLELVRNLVKDANRNSNTKIHAFYTFICPFNDNATFNRDLAMSETEFKKHADEIRELTNLKIHQIAERHPGVSERDIYATVFPKVAVPGKTFLNQESKITTATAPPEKSKKTIHEQKKIEPDKNKKPLVAEDETSIKIENTSTKKEKAESPKNPQPQVAPSNTRENTPKPVTASTFQNCKKLKFDSYTLITCDVEAERCDSSLLRITTISAYPDKTHSIKIVYEGKNTTVHIGETANIDIKKGNNVFYVTEIKSPTEIYTLPFIFN